jgi:hypothetical protein
MKRENWLILSMSLSFLRGQEMEETKLQGGPLLYLQEHCLERICIFWGFPTPFPPAHLAGTDPES